MDRISEELLGSLDNKIAFTLPLLGGVPASVVTTWVLIGLAALFFGLCSRKFKVVPGRMQSAIELLMEFLHDFFYGILGEEGKGYIPYLCTTIIFIALSNLCGLIGLTPPTKDLNVTAGLALISIVLIEFSGIHKKGWKKWLKSFAEPVPLIAPINVLEVVIRPLSLCMRLFGNVLGSFVVMELIKLVVPVGVPVALSLYFDVFDGLIQAYVFVFLTSLFIKEAIE